MKERPQYDFPVKVAKESTEHESIVAAAAYDGIYTAILNHRIWVVFVPAFSREPWPPQPSDDIDAVADDNEARRSTVALASYAVTPESFPGLHDTKLISELPTVGALALQRFLLDVFIASNRLNADELALLGRAKAS